VRRSDPDEEWLRLLYGPDLDACEGKTEDKISHDLVDRLRADASSIRALRSRIVELESAAGDGA